MPAERPMIIGNIPKLPAKWATIVMPFILSGLMSGIISFINMLRNLGWIDGFMNLWFHNWMISWAFAFPIVLILFTSCTQIDRQTGRSACSEFTQVNQF